MTHNPSLIDELIAASSSGSSIMESRNLIEKSLPPGKTEVVQQRIIDTPDHTSYHLLLYLKKHAPEELHAIPQPLQATVLCDALNHVTYCNDFGYLEPSESFTKTSGKMLVLLGEAALPPLREMLNNNKEAPLFGMEEATLSSIYAYRRKDFAWYFLSQIEGRDFSFPASPEERDLQIEAYLHEME